MIWGDGGVRKGNHKVTMRSKWLSLQEKKHRLLISLFIVLFIEECSFFSFLDLYFFLTVSSPFSVGSSCHGRHLVWVQKTDMVGKSLLSGWLLVRLPFTVPTTAKSQLQLEYTQEDPQNKPPLYSHSCLKDGQCYSASFFSTKTLSWYRQC